MKLNVFLASLMASIGICTPSFGFGLLDQMLGVGGCGCDVSCCALAAPCGCKSAPNCGCGPAAFGCSPIVGGPVVAHPAHVNPGCGCAVPSCGCAADCCRHRCCPMLNLSQLLNSIFASHKCRVCCSARPHCGYGAPPSCGCGAGPGCGCAPAFHEGIGPDVFVPDGIVPGDVGPSVIEPNTEVLPTPDSTKSTSKPRAKPVFGPMAPKVDRSAFVPKNKYFVLPTSASDDIDVTLSPPIID